MKSGFSIENRQFVPYNEGQSRKPGSVFPESGKVGSVVKKGPLCVLACYVIWGMLPIYWRLFSAVNSLYILAARIVWSLVLMGIVLLIGKRREAVLSVLKDKRELRRLVLAGIAVCVNWGSYIWAVNGGHGVDASLAYYMNPILTIFLATMVFREKLTKLQWLSVAVTFTGLVAAVIRYRQIPWAALIIGGSFAVYGAIKKGVKSPADVSLFFETLVLAPAALVLMLVMEVQGNGALSVLSGVRLMLLPTVGAVTTIPLLYYAKGIRETPMSLAGILMYINPTLQLLISVVLFHEAFTTTHAILFVFVWSGLALYLAAAGREKRKEKIR